MTELSAYALSPLREGPFTLHRGLGDGLSPILLVAPAGEYPSPNIAKIHFQTREGVRDGRGWVSRRRISRIPKAKHLLNVIGALRCHIPSTKPTYELRRSFGLVP